MGFTEVSVVVLVLIFNVDDDIVEVAFFVGDDVVDVVLEVGAVLDVKGQEMQKVRRTYKVSAPSFVTTPNFFCKYAELIPLSHFQSEMLICKVV